MDVTLFLITPGGGRNTVPNISRWWTTTVRSNGWPRSGGSRRCTPPLSRGWRTWSVSGTSTRPASSATSSSDITTTSSMWVNSCYSFFFFTRYLSPPPRSENILNLSDVYMLVQSCWLIILVQYIRCTTCTIYLSAADLSVHLSICPSNYTYLFYLSDV